MPESNPSSNHEQYSLESIDPVINRIRELIDEVVFAYPRSLAVVNEDEIDDLKLDIGVMLISMIEEEGLQDHFSGRVHVSSDGVGIIMRDIDVNDDATDAVVEIKGKTYSGVFEEIIIGPAPWESGLERFFANTPRETDYNEFCINVLLKDVTTYDESGKLVRNGGMPRILVPLSYIDTHFSRVRGADNVLSPEGGIYAEDKTEEITKHFNNEEMIDALTQAENDLTYNDYSSVELSSLRKSYQQTLTEMTGITIGDFVLVDCHEALMPDGFNGEVINTLANYEGVMMVQAGDSWNAQHAFTCVNDKGEIDVQIRVNPHDIRTALRIVDMSSKLA